MFGVCGGRLLTLTPPLVPEIRFAVDSMDFSSGLVIKDRGRRVKIREGDANLSSVVVVSRRGCAQKLGPATLIEMPHGPGLAPKVLCGIF